MSSSKNKFTLLKQKSVTDISVGFRPPCWCSSRRAPAWCLLTNLLILWKHFVGYLVYEILLWPESWRGSFHIYLLSFARLIIIIIILDFIYWTVLTFILIYFEMRDTENQQLRESDDKILNFFIRKLVDWAEIYEKPEMIITRPKKFSPICLIDAAFLKKMFVIFNLNCNLKTIVHLLFRNKDH